MSSRSRTSRAAGSYTARLKRPTAYRPPRTWPAWLAWLAAPWLPAILVLAAEAGHLGAALTEWPAGPVRGLFHVLAAATLGALAVSVYFAPSRRTVALGLAVTATLPACWLAGTLAGLSPYRDHPWPAAVAQTAVEVAAAVLLAGHWYAAARRAARRPVQAGQATRRQSQRQPA